MPSTHNVVVLLFICGNALRARRVGEVLDVRLLRAVVAKPANQSAALALLRKK